MSDGGRREIQLVPAALNVGEGRYIARRVEEGGCVFLKGEVDVGALPAITPLVATLTPVPQAAVTVSSRPTSTWRTPDVCASLLGATICLVPCSHRAQLTVHDHHTAFTALPPPRVCVELVTYIHSFAP